MYALAAANAFVLIDHGNAMLIVGDRIDRTAEFAGSFK